MVDTLLFKEIRSLTTLRPSPETNQAFSNLVTFCLTAEEKDITLSPKDITTLQELSSLAESEMETYWAKRIIASQNPNEELLHFWYYTNYSMLTDLEYKHTSLIRNDLKKILFVGGGPLPLSSILLCQKYNLRCTILEKDQASSDLATQLIEALGLSESISIKTINAAEYTNYNQFDSIIIAALVGNTPAIKDTIIRTIHANMEKDSLLLCRHAHGARKLLYPPISSSTIKEMKPIIEVAPSHSIINSFFILQKT